MRRTIMRYICLSLTLVLTDIAPGVKKRFPTLQHYVDAGLMVENERIIIDDLNQKFPKHSKHWLPIVWASSIVTRARSEGRIRYDFAVKSIIDELIKFREKCGLLISYNLVTVPLVYTQVVTIAVYAYFLTGLVSLRFDLDNRNGQLMSINQLIRRWVNSGSRMMAKSTRISSIATSRCSVCCSSSSTWAG